MAIEVGGETFLNLDEAAAYSDADFLNLVPVYFKYKGLALLGAKEALVNGMVRIDLDTFRQLRIEIGEGKPVVVYGGSCGNRIMRNESVMIGYRGRNLCFERGVIDGEKVVSLGLRKMTMPETGCIEDAAMFVGKSSLDAIAQKLEITQNRPSMGKQALRETDFLAWMEAENLDKEAVLAMGTSKVQDALTNRNASLWASGFNDFWKNQNIIKRKRGRPLGS